MTSSNRASTSAAARADVAPRDGDSHGRARLVGGPCRGEEPSPAIAGIRVFGLSDVEDHAARRSPKLHSERPILPLDERHEWSESLNDRESHFVNLHCHERLLPSHPAGAKQAEGDRPDGWEGGASTAKHKCPNERALYRLTNDTARARPVPGEAWRGRASTIARMQEETETETETETVAETETETETVSVWRWL